MSVWAQTAIVAVITVFVMNGVRDVLGRTAMWTFGLVAIALCVWALRDNANE